MQCSCFAQIMAPEVSPAVGREPRPSKFIYRSGFGFISPGRFADDATATTAAASQFSVRYNFKGGRDGFNAMLAGRLVIDAKGRIYGTTYQGGGNPDCRVCGTVFALTPNDIRPEGRAGRRQCRASAEPGCGGRPLVGNGSLVGL
jgi:hypothetical protein